MLRPLHIKNAKIYDFSLEGDRRVNENLYTSDIVLDKPHPDALVVDLEGHEIIPALINAHDHLELNHFPRTKFREVYPNAHEWGEDVNARLNTEPYKSLRAYPLWDKLFIGALKNLLSGVTTVAQHGTPHPQLFHKDFPVRVMRPYGWAHSLHFSTEAEIVASYQNTPKDVPWFIHLAEGTDSVASEEYRVLKALGCVGKNTVLIHGVGLSKDDIVDASQLVRGLIWCPSTNNYLLGKTFQDVAQCLLYGGKIALGSDSRLTADGDLLNESKKSILTLQVNHEISKGMMTWQSANILGFSDIGHLGQGAKADWIILGQDAERVDIIGQRFSLTFFDVRRKNLKLVVKGGIPQIGDPDLMAKFPHIETVSATLDGVAKAINIKLARQIQKCKLKESGLELLETPKKRFIFF